MTRLTIAGLILCALTAPTFGQEKTRLQFLMLANSKDDAKVIKDAKGFCADPANEEAIAKCQMDGVPPSAPTVKYEIVTYKGAKSVVTYRWVQLGQAEMHQLNLDNDAENDGKRNHAWKEASKNRNRATTLSESPDFRLLEGALFFSRECKSRKLTAEERGKVKVEYFVLARNPEVDTEGIGSKHIMKVELAKTTGELKRPGLWVHFNSDGAKLLKVLTEKNRSEGPERESSPQTLRRYLAIIIDDRVLSAPTINSTISDGRALISGNLTQKDVDELAQKLTPKK
jgi:hypothetical protein